MDNNKGKLQGGAVEIDTSSAARNAVDDATRVVPTKSVAAAEKKAEPVKNVMPEKKVESAKTQAMSTKTNAAKTVTGKPASVEKKDESVKNVTPEKKNDSPTGERKMVDVKETTGTPAYISTPTDIGKKETIKLEKEEVDDDMPTPIKRKEGITVGSVIGGFFEVVWTVFKLAVLVSVVIAIAGFFLCREMLIRGRNGNLKSLSDMHATSTILANKDKEDTDVAGWLKRVKREKLTLESDDGKILVARKVMAEGESDKWVVVLHGYNGSMEDIYDIAMHYYNEGFNVLMPDLRASGESEGSFIGMGWLDRLDVINWIDVILEEQPDARIAIHGVDMGADTAIMLSGEPIKDNIRVIVADGAYTSAWDVLKKEFKLRHEKLPVFPVMEMVNPVARIWGGYTLREASAVKQAEKSKVPTLLIRGGNDTYVTAEMTDKLNASMASIHKVDTISSGNHDDSRYADPDAYYKDTFDYVKAQIID